MNNIRLILIFAVAFALLGTCAMAQEMLANPGFEDGGTNGLPLGWTKYSGQDATQKLAIVADAHSGGSALRLTDDGETTERDNRYAVGVSQRVPAEAEKWYVLSAWVKTFASQGKNALTLQLRFEPSGELIEQSLNSEVGGDWTRYKITGQAPAGTTEILMYVYTLHYTTVDAVVDDISLQAVDMQASGMMVPLMRWGSDGIEAVRVLNLQTPLASEETAAARILIPEGEKYVLQGNRIARAIEKQTGAKLVVTSEYDGTVESAETIIALGNLNNNRMIERLYMNKYVEIDSLKPSAGRYVLQTVHEPYNSPKGKNVVVIGASDDAGLDAGVADFVARLNAGDFGEALELKIAEPILYVSGVEAMSAQARAEMLTKPISQDALKDFWSAAQQYRDTGDTAYAERARDALLYCGQRLQKNLDYRITWPEETTSNNIGAMWDVVEEAPVFTDAERLECTNILLCTMYTMPRHVSYWSRLEDHDTILYNHTTFPLLGIYWMARYFERYYGNVDGQIEAFLAKCKAFNGQRKSWKPQEDSMGYYVIVPRHTIEYTLAENDYTYFENGQVLKHCQYTPALCDNTGDAANFGDNPYSRSVHLGNMEWAIWYYKDPKILWWINNVKPGGWANPYDQSIVPEEWTELQGVNITEMHPEVYKYTQETADFGDVVTPPNFPIEQCFDKISFRENLDANGEYFLLDGYSRGKHLQYDGNSIIKFYADGEDWIVDGDYLVRNTTDHNGVSVIRNGRADELIPSVVGLLAVADLPHAGMTQTRVNEFNGADWMRNIFWLKGECVVVLDEMEAREAADFSFVGNWKTIGEGERAVEENRIFAYKRIGGSAIGHMGLASRRNPVEGIEEAMEFRSSWSQLDTYVTLPEGEFSLTLMAKGHDGSSDSLYVQIDGGERVDFHIPNDTFGRSSVSWTGEQPTPKMNVVDAGVHRLTITLREGPGVMIDKFVIAGANGAVLAEVEAEDAPSITPQMVAGSASKDFYVKNDGVAANSIAGRLNNEGVKVRYFRQRFGKQMEPGERMTLQNLFYNDTSDNQKAYDIRRLTDRTSIILKDGKAVGVAAFGDGNGSAFLDGASMMLAIGDRYFATGVTAVDGLFASDKPMAVEIDFADGKAYISGSEDATVKMADGTPVKLKNGQTALDCRRWAGTDKLRSEVAELVTSWDADDAEAPNAAVNRPQADSTMETVWETAVPLQPDERDEEILELLTDDLDGDGNEEILVLRGRTARCLDADGNVAWEFMANGICRAVTTYDVDGDGVKEVFVGSDDEHVYVLRANGEEINRHHCDIPLRIGRSHTKTPKISSICVGDLEGNGGVDVIVCTLNSNLLRYDMEFDLKWRYDNIPHGSMEMVLMDMDHDGVKEILVANKYGAVQIFNAAGNNISATYSELGDVRMAIGNSDADGAYEIANGSSTGAFSLMEYGKQYEFKFPNYGFGCTEVLMGDVTAGAEDEIILGSETGYVYVMDGTGAMLAQKNFGDTISDIGLGMFGGEKALMGVSVRSGGVYVMDGDGELLAEWDSNSQAVLVDELVADGQRYLLAATGNGVNCLRW